MWNAIRTWISAQIDDVDEALRGPLAIIIVFLGTVTLLGFVPPTWVWGVADDIVYYLTIGLAVGTVIWVAWNFPTITLLGGAARNVTIPRTRFTIGGLIFVVLVPAAVAVGYGFMVYWLPTYRAPVGFLAITAMGIVLLFLGTAKGILATIIRLILTVGIFWTLFTMVHLRDDLGTFNDKVTASATGDSEKELRKARQATEKVQAAMRKANREIEAKILEKDDAAIEQWLIDVDADLKAGKAPRPSPTPYPRPGKPTAANTSNWRYGDEGSLKTYSASVRLCELDTTTFVCKTTGDPAKDTWFQSKQKWHYRGADEVTLVRWEVATGVGHWCFDGACHYQRFPVRNVMETEPDTWAGEGADRDGSGWDRFKVSKVSQ